MRYIIMFFLSLSVTSCAQNQQSNFESINKVNSADVMNTTANSKLSVNKQRMVKLVDGSDLMYDATTLVLNEPPLRCPSTGINIKARSIEYDENKNQNKIEIDEWNVFLKKFITSIPEENRDNLLRYSLTCREFTYDNLENIVHFHNTIFYSGDDRINIRVTGHWKYNDIPILSLSFGYRFTMAENYAASRLENLNGQGIKIYADDFQWEKQIIFEKTGGIGNEKAEISLLDDDFFDAINKLSDAKKSIIRFYGDKHYDELELNDVTKCKLKSLVLAVRGFIKKTDVPKVAAKSIRKHK